MAKLKTINNIRKVRDQIRKKIKDVDTDKYKDRTFGPENEYTYKGMIGGIESILTDISTLTQYENNFVKLSTYNGRQKILRNLKHIQTHLKSPNNLFQYIDNLKTSLRSYNIRNFSENLIEFTKEIDDIRKLKLQVQKSLKEINKEKNGIEQKHKESSVTLDRLENQLKKLNETISIIKSNSKELKSTNEELLDIKSRSQKAFNSVRESANEAKSNKKLIESFANNVEERNKKLTEIEQKTAEYDVKLKEYEEERKNILKESEQLIKSAKQALNYKTAEGLSASFHSQYKNAKEGKLKAWIIGAIICLTITLSLGVWLLFDTDASWQLILGRVLLLPIPIAATFFCAQQYNKQKNIIEDYAYKTTIAKAIVGFSEQLKKNGKEEDNSEYVEYIQKALAEIHKDPLRPRKEEKQKDLPASQFDQVLTVAKKIVEFSKSTPTH